MDQAGKSFTSDSTDARRWIGRIIMAVILGEAIWSVIVSVMNNVVVPWLGDLFGQSSGLPTSFTQRPYNYPDLFVSFIEFCIAGLVAASINYFFQRPGTRRVKQKTLAPTVPVPPVRVVPQTAPASLSQVPSPPAPAPAAIEARSDSTTCACAHGGYRSFTSCRAGSAAEIGDNRSISTDSSELGGETPAACGKSPTIQTEET